MTLADVPLETRCEAAVAVIWQDATLGIRGRLEIVAAAIWPVTPSAGPRSVVASATNSLPGTQERWSALDERDEARRRFSAGATISEIAESRDVPWRTVQEWCRTRG